MGIFLLSILVFFLAMNTVSAEANLTVTSINTNSSIGTEEEMNVTYTVQNQGNETYYPGNNFGKGAPTTIFVSTNNTWDETDINIGTLWYDDTNPPIAPGESYSQTITVGCPGVPEGNYYLIAGIDFYQIKASGTYYQVENRHGLYASPIYINNPDLTITNYNMPTSAGANEEITISFTVENQGSSEAGPKVTGTYFWDGVIRWFDSIYFSTDSQLNESDILLKEVLIDGPLNVVDNYTNTFTFRLPNVITGNYYLIAKTNSHYGESTIWGPRYTYEFNLENNVLAVPITVFNPDLTISNAVVPTILKSLEYFSMSYTVLNQGNGDAAGGIWYDHIYLSEDDILDDLDLLLDSSSRNGLESGANYTKYMDGGISGALLYLPFVQAGNYFMIIKTDGDNRVLESDENNNEFAVPVYVANNIWNVNPGDVIQNVINSASPGDVINVHGDNGNPYTYFENILIDKKLFIQGYGDGAIIQALDLNLPTILISGVNDSIIKNLNITGGSDGLKLDNAFNCSLIQNNITGNNFAGVYLLDSSSNNIKGNNIENNPYGIFSEFSDSNVISDNHITESDYAGIMLRYWSESNEIYRNIIEDNGYGLHLLYSSGNDIFENQIKNNYFYGAYIDNSQNNNIMLNEITGNPYAGLALYFAANNNWVMSNNLTGNGFGTYIYSSNLNTFQDNQISNNSFYGLYLDNSDENILGGDNSYYLGNIIENNPYAGIALNFGSENNHIDNNLINGNGYGIQITSSDGNLLGLWGSNSLVNNTFYGVYLDNSDNTYIAPLSVSGSSYAGIAIYNGCDGTFIDGATIEDNGYGIYSYNSSQSYIVSCDISNNDFYGVYMDNSDENTLDSNQISGNPYTGVAMYFGSDYNTIMGNAITDNGFGMYLYQSIGNEMFDNWVQNTYYGIYLDQCNMNSMHENQLLGNSYANLALYNSYDNIIYNTTSQMSGFGIYLENSGGNNIYRSNFLDNTNNAYDNGTNIWDNGTIGNYWDDWTEPDNNNDGIVDNPRPITGGNQDNKPTTAPLYQEIP